MTKAQKAMVATYNTMTAENLYQIYNTCSAAKMKAYDYCREFQYRLGGYGVKVKKCGTYFFTYAFKYKEDEKEFLCYMTGKNTYRFCID